MKKFHTHGAERAWWFGIVQVRGIGLLSTPADRIAPRRFPFNSVLPGVLWVVRNTFQNWSPFIDHDFLLFPPPLCLCKLFIVYSSVSASPFFFSKKCIRIGLSTSVAMHHLPASSISSTWYVLAATAAWLSELPWKKGGISRIPHPFVTYSPAPGVRVCKICRTASPKEIFLPLLPASKSEIPRNRSLLIKQMTMTASSSITHQNPPNFFTILRYLLSNSLHACAPVSKRTGKSARKHPDFLRYFHFYYRIQYKRYWKSTTAIPAIPIFGYLACSTRLAWVTIPWPMSVTYKCHRTAPCFQLC